MRIPAAATVLLSAVLALTACDSELDGKVAAEVKDVPTATADAPADKADTPAGQTTTWAFDNSTGTIAWVGRKVTKDHDGGFQKFDGQVEVAGDELRSVKVTVDLSSVTSDSEKLTGHLKSPDFFDVEKYSTATFTSSSIQPKDGQHLVTGVFDFHGHQKEIAFPVTVHKTEGKAHVTGEFKIDRQQWELSYPGKPDDLINDEVLIKLDLNVAPKDS